MKTALKIFVALAVATSSVVAPTAAQAAPAGHTVMGMKAPAGSKVVGNWVVGPDGAQMSVTPMAYSDCPGTWWCLYQDVNWSGRMLKFGGTYHGNLSDWGFNDAMSSFRNNSSTDARWYEGPEGQWFNPCHNMPAYSASSSVQPNDTASSIAGGGLC